MAFKLTTSELAELAHHGAAIEAASTWLHELSEKYQEKHDAKSDAWKASDKGASVQNWIECLSDASEQAGDASENFVAIDIEPEESK
jgi:hypothetical protein